MRRAVLLALATFALAACSNDSGGGGGGGGAGGQAGAAADGGAPCPAELVGTWTMVSVFCGTNDVTQDIKTKGGVSAMKLELSDTGKSCKLVPTVSGPTCEESEEVELLPLTGGSFDLLSSKGITSCQPAQCTFNANDAPCVIGDRADQDGLTSMKYDGSTLVVTSQPPAGACQSFGLATIVTYSKS